MNICFKIVDYPTLIYCDININKCTKNVFIFESYNKGNLKTKMLCVIPFRSGSTNESTIPSNIFIPE